MPGLFDDIPITGQPITQQTPSLSNDLFGDIPVTNVPASGIGPEVNAALRPKFQDIPVYEQQPETNSLGDLFVAGGRDAYRALNQVAGNLREGLANKADEAQLAGQIVTGKQIS